jgi:hypothetical protein
MPAAGWGLQGSAWLWMVKQLVVRLNVRKGESAHQQICWHTLLDICLKLSLPSAAPTKEHLSSLREQRAMRAAWTTGQGHCQ